MEQLYQMLTSQPGGINGQEPISAAVERGICLLLIPEERKRRPPDGRQLVPPRDLSIIWSNIQRERNNLTFLNLTW